MRHRASECSGSIAPCYRCKHCSSPRWLQRESSKAAPSCISGRPFKVLLFLSTQSPGPLTVHLFSPACHTPQVIAQLLQDKVTLHKPGAFNAADTAGSGLTVDECLSDVSVACCRLLFSCCKTRQGLCKADVLSHPLKALGLLGPRLTAVCVSAPPLLRCRSSFNCCKTRQPCARLMSLVLLKQLA